MKKQNEILGMMDTHMVFAQMQTLISTILDTY